MGIAEEAYRFILDNEAMTAVIIPDLSAAGSNRRREDRPVCQPTLYECERDALTLYAGGGYWHLPNWMMNFKETEKKMQTTKNLNTL